MKDDRLVRRKARAELESLAVQCLPAAAHAHASDALIDPGFSWATAGRTSVLMAKEIRLSCAREVSDFDDEGLLVLAKGAAQEPKGEAN